MVEVSQPLHRLFLLFVQHNTRPQLSLLASPVLRSAKPWLDRRSKKEGQASNIKSSWAHRESVSLLLNWLSGFPVKTHMIFISTLRYWFSIYFLFFAFTAIFPNVRVKPHVGGCVCVVLCLSKVNWQVQVVVSLAGNLLSSCSEVREGVSQSCCFFWQHARLCLENKLN